MEVTMEEEHNELYSSPYENYLRLLQTIETIESGARLTEDWYEEHREHIQKYREVFPNFHKINEDIHNTEFRTKAIEAEVLLSNLVNELQVRNIFTVRTYLILNKRLKDLCEFIWGEDELLDMLRRMGL